MHNLNNEQQNVTNLALDLDLGSNVGSGAVFTFQASFISTFFTHRKEMQRNVKKTKQNS